MEDKIESFRKYLELSKSKATVKSYMHTINKFIEYMHSKGKDIEDTTVHDVVEYLSQFSPRYAHRQAYALKLFFEYIGMNQLAVQIPTPKYTTTLPEWIEKEELMSGIEILKEIADARDDLIGYRNLVAIWLAYEAALRIGELEAMNREDINLEKKEVLVHREKTKGGEIEDHLVPISDELAQYLAKYLSKRQDNEPALIVCGDPPARCSRESIRQIFKQFARLIDKPHLKFHSLRHSRLTHLAIEGVDVATLAKLAHHKNPQSTLIYIHLSSDYLRKKLYEKNKIQ